MTVEIVKKLNYALLKPKKLDEIPKQAVQIIENLTAKQAVYILSTLEDKVAVDIETKGNNVANSFSYIVGIGLADSKSIYYIDRKSANKGAWDLLFKRLADARFKLFGHNIFFDAAYITRDYPNYLLNWEWCTYGMLRQLANEGWDGQTWGLKDAQINLLGWEETNEAELDRWLVKRGLFMTDLKKNPEGNHQYPVLNKAEELRYARPNKAEMWQAPPSILGYYCGVDAASTYMLMTEILEPAIKSLPDSAQSIFNEYHKMFITNVKILIEQQLYGVNIDTRQLKTYHSKLLNDIEESKQLFLKAKELAPYFNQIKQEALDELKLTEPAKYKKHKLPKEPTKFLKGSDKVSPTWLKWKAKVDQDTGPEVSKNWLNWQERYNELNYNWEFNLNSGPALQDLFYTRLGHPVKVRTDSDQPATDSSALKFFGEPGRLLQTYKDLVKEEGYVKACLEKTYYDTLNLQFRVPGTLTGRLAGSGGLNVQQLPKSKGYLECWKPRKGHVWIDCDINSLEQVVLAELSQDPALLSLYGPDAKKGNDVYLFNGAQMKGIGEKIRQFYDPLDFTEESINKAKKECKKERSIAKLITLASSYGAGPDKLYTNMTLDGIDITMDEVRQMHRSYWDIYKGVKSYGYILEEEWQERGGWVFNGLGRPICVAEDKKKDLVNRVVQSTGHDILMMIIQELDTLRKRYIQSNKGLIWKPVIIDFHDESIVECKEEDAERVMDMFREAYRIVNQKLNCGVKIAGEPEIIYSLADAKVKD